MQTIVIVGGGAGGLELATRLGDSAGKAGTARIVLVDRHAAHFWKPLLHTVASGKRDAHASQIGYAAQACEHGFEFVRGEVLGVDRTAQSIAIAPLMADDGSCLRAARSIGYDKLVLALGAVTNLFGVPGAAEHVLTLDSVAEAEAFRQRFIDGCIRASEQAQHAGIDIVIVGGGATGVELAAELSHSARALARYKVHALDPVRHVRIRIVERGSRLLAHMHPRQSKRALRHLRFLGIRVVTDCAVARVDANAVIDTGGTAYPSSITLWAAGVEGPAMCSALDLPLNRLRQIRVAPSLQSVADQRIYALGDCASFTCPVQGVVPPRAMAAHQQAVFLAQTLVETGPAAFAYRDYGSLVSLGPLAAVGVMSASAQGSKLQVKGVLARMLYALMYRKHQMALHGFARMAASAVAEWLAARISPPVRLH